MIFDLSSSPRRKMVVRVVFGFLAVIFAGGFILFGIGGELGGGGLFDGLFGSSGGSSTAEQYEQQVEDAESKLEEDPGNERALTDLIQFRFLSGQAQLEYDEATGQPSGLTEESRGEFEEVVVNWDAYLDTKPDKIAAATASNVVNALRFLGDSGGAADAQAALAKSDPSATNYAALANLRYQDLDLKAGDAAKDRALADAKPNIAKQIKAQLDPLREQVVKFKKDQAKLPESEDPGAGALGDPFGGLSPDAGGGLTPAPAP